MFLLKLDGNLTQSKVLGLKNGTITLRREEKGNIVYGFSSELVFLKGQDYDYIKLKLIDDPKAIDNIIVVTLIDDCCDKEYSFKLTAENIDWCDDECKITANLIEFNENTKAYDCIESTMIWADASDIDGQTPFIQRQHPRILYCNEIRPVELQHFIGIIAIVLVTGLLPVFAVIGAIGTVINLIIAGVNLVPGVSIPLIGDGDINVFDDAKVWFENLATFAIGCGRRHPSPLVRDYIKNVCSKCGLTFQSSIFNDPASIRYNAVYLSAEVEKGVKLNSSSYWIDDNRPLHTGQTFLDDIIKTVINGKWRIVGNVLILERKDYFKSNTPWLDVADLTDEQKISLCYNWTATQRPAFGIFNYSPDYLDYVGNENKKQYSDIVEWNDPYSPLQKGSEKITLTFGTPKFRNETFFDEFFQLYEDIGIYSFLKQYHGAMIMSHGVASQPKILIWDGASVDAAKVVTQSSGGLFPGNYYNMPMVFDENKQNELYHDFYEIDNPKNLIFAGKDFTLKVRYDCEMVNKVDIDQGIKVNGIMGEVNTIEINSNKRTLEIKGTI